MKQINVFMLTGNEILAQDIVSASGILLIPKGTELKLEYVDKLIELKYENIYIKDKFDDLTTEEVEVMNECKEKVKNLVERFFYRTDSKLSELQEVAEDIIADAFNTPEVVVNVNNIRRNSEDKYMHSVNVCSIAVIIAIDMKLDKDKIRDIAIGALLHDIGYSYIKSMLETQNEKISEEALKKEMKKHVVYGYSMMENEDWISNVSKDIILSHHERVDGSGYPFRRKGDEIKIGSQIVAVADVFDNIINGTDKEEAKVYNAIEKIVCKAGILYNEKVVNSFRNNIAVYPNGSKVRTNENETAIVIRQNSKFPTRPVIKIIRDSNGKQITAEVIKDLTKYLTTFIESTLN